MLRFGIFRAEDYRPAPAGAPRIVRMAYTSRRVSLQLLRTALPPSPAELAVFRHLVTGLRLSSGIFRTTYSGRFSDVDVVVNALLRERHPPGAALEAHDWAASDCLTSAEWAASLFALFPRATLTASDLSLFLVEATLPDGAIFFLEQNGQPLQYVRPPFVVRLVPPEPMPMLVNRWLGHRARARLRATPIAIPPAWLELDDEELSTPAAVLRKVPLTHPAARLLASRDARFSMRRHSVFEPLDRGVDVIRTMNIFNRDYFPPARLLDGVRAVWASLNRGGVWIVGRTMENENARNDVTIFERTDDGFGVVRRIGVGSEVEELVVSAGAARIR